MIYKVTESKLSSIYNSGIGGYNPTPTPTLDHLVLCEYFNQRFGAELTTGTINNFYFDNTCPLNIAGGAPYSKNNDYSSLHYNDVNAVVQSGTFTIEFFLKVETDGSVTNSAPTAIVDNTGDSWIVGLCPSSLDSTKIYQWHSDVYSIVAIPNTKQWNHYEISVENGNAFYFINGVRYSIYNVILGLSGSWFAIADKRNDRCIFRIAQVAVWDICKHKENFSVDYNPIAYS